MLICTKLIPICLSLAWTSFSELPTVYSTSIVGFLTGISDLTRPVLNSWLLSPNLFSFLPFSNMPSSHFHEGLFMGLLAWDALPQQIQCDWCVLNLCDTADFLSASLMLSWRAHLKCHLPEKLSLIASSGVGLPYASRFRIGLFASELIICVGKKEHIQWFLASSSPSPPTLHL